MSKRFRINFDVNVVEHKFATGEVYYEPTNKYDITVQCDCLGDHSLCMNEVMDNLKYYPLAVLNELCDAMSEWLTHDFEITLIRDRHGELTIRNIISDHLIPEIVKRKEVISYEREIAGYVAKET